MALTDDLAARVTETLMGLISATPTSTHRLSERPKEAAQRITRVAARKSAAVSGTLALPTGPLGMATLLPDLLVVWKIQQQMVADIAAVHGRSDAVNAQTMTYCMFRHSSASIVQDLVGRAGGRSLVRRATASMIRSVLKRIGLRLTRLVLGKTVARLIPLVGAAAVAGYAYSDTVRVAATAIELFGRDIDAER